MKFVLLFIFCFCLIPNHMLAQGSSVKERTDREGKNYVEEGKLRAQHSVQNDFNIVEDEIRKLLDRYHAVGLSVAVVKNDKLLYAKGFGFSNLEKRIPADKNTIYGIGSVTKSFTASILGVLEGEGTISLDHNPSRYIRELMFHTKDMNAQIRLHHMLNHTTGISNLSSESSAVLFISDTPEDLIPRLAHLKPSAGVGERLMYNNYIYTVAGMVGERVTGKKWGENLKTMLFKPLQMNRTFSSFYEARVHSNFSMGYAVDSIYPKKVLPEIVPTRAPAGSIFSTAVDMSKWLQVWMEKGKVNGKQVIPSNYVAQATKKQVLFSGNENDSLHPASYYGYGWLVRNFRGMKRVEHSGGVSGYGSNVVFFPEEKLGIVVLTNQTTSSLSFAVTDLLVNKLLNLKEPLSEVQFAQTHRILEDLPTTINQSNKPSHVLKDFEGKYYHPGFGTVSISLEKNTLYADFPLTRFRLTHRERNQFVDHFTKEIPLMMWNFMQFNFLEEKGKINALSLNFSDEPVIFKKMNK